MRLLLVFSQLTGKIRRQTSSCSVKSRLVARVYFQWIFTETNDRCTLFSV